MFGVRFILSPTNQIANNEISIDIFPVYYLKRRECDDVSVGVNSENKYICNSFWVPPYN